MSVFAGKSESLTRLLLCAAAVLTLCAAARDARAVDFSYSGALDSETGLPYSSVEETASNEVVISDTMYFSRADQLYAYPVGSGVSRVRASVADGMIVTEPVRLTADDGVTLTIYRNGTELPMEGTDVLSETGQYVVSAKEGDASRNIFSFSIVGERAALPGGYTMPEGFYILEAVCEGEDTYYDRNYIAMEQEGTYRVEYVCPDNGMRYTLLTTVDRTPPALTLEGRRDSQGRFHSAVNVLGLEADDTVTLTRDNVEVSLPLSGRLTESGVYTLEAFDSAGNSTAEQFTILVYFDLNSLLFFSLVCFSLAGVLGYVLYKRKNLKII